MTTPREQLAETLKQSRLDAGFDSHGALAKRLNVSRPVVSKAENPAHPVPSDAILAAWAGATGVGLKVLTDLAERSRSGTPDWFMPYRQAEAEATILRCWSPFVVPGIGQTRGYMRALFQDEGHYLDQVDELIAARLERQQVIGRTPVTLVIGQAVLSRPVGTPAVMAERCAHLLTIAEHSGVALHVLPDSTSMGSYGAFDIATSYGAVTVRLETVEDITSTAPDLVSKVTLAFERILGAALPRSDSLTLVRTAEGSWKAQTESWKAQA
jgi:transcriptional regulator with XRE-family HTH domain